MCRHLVRKSSPGGHSRQLSGPSHSASMPESQLPRCVVVPTQDSESAQCIPAACTADIGLHLQWNMFGMKEVQRPPPVLVAALDHDFDGIPNVAVGFDSCVPQIIESAQDVVVPKRREREVQPALVDDFVSSNR